MFPIDSSFDEYAEYDRDFASVPPNNEKIIEEVDHFVVSPNNERKSGDADFGVVSQNKERSSDGVRPVFDVMVV